MKNTPIEDPQILGNSGDEKQSNPIVDRIFNIRQNFAIIGLAGRTGSGCTTVAELLSRKAFEDFAPPKPAINKASDNDHRKYLICYNYLEKNWTSAIHIKVVHLIILICLQEGFDEFVKNIELWYNSTITNSSDEETKKRARIQKAKKIISTISLSLEKQSKDIYTDAVKYYKQLHSKEYKNESDTRPIVDLDNFLTKKLPEYYNFIKKEINDASLSFIEIFQLFGNYIRESGFKGNDDYSIIRLINLVIKFHRYKKNEIEKEKAVFVIDALRNPYEVHFLRERYSSFYLMSINVEEKTRKDRLAKLNYSLDQIKDCDKVEYPQKPTLSNVYIYQNIEKCTEISDIHIVNPDTDSFRNDLKKQLVRYLSLISHPGLIPPTGEERTMQIAYTAKYNSGCISRQVGAVITDDNFSIKAIGWNDVPEGQTPCILRDSVSFIKTGQDKKAFSSYEIHNEKFQLELKDKVSSRITAENKIKLKGRNVPYCFKDIHDKQNQVHTRSLHAEENAFLQIVKCGGQGILGGKLFTTASPCELCAKKAYQLGVKDIYYIDLYPGISKDHILDNGSRRPEMRLFKGAIGRAYIHLYQPLLSYKDEIRNILT